MRPGRCTDAIERRLDIRHPIAQRLIHRILQRACAGGDRHDLRAKQAHTEHVRLLPLHVRLAHEDDAFKAEARADRRRRDAVLARACLRNDPLLAHAPREQDLPEAIVDLVRAGMVQLVALEVDFRPPEMPGQALGKVERRRAAHIVGPQVLHLGRKGRVLPGLAVLGLKLQHEGHQRLGDISSAELAEPAIRVRPFVPGIAQVHHSSSDPRCAMDRAQGCLGSFGRADEGAHPFPVL